MSRHSEKPTPVAAVITEWRKNSHADVILSRLLEPSEWGHSKPFRLKLAAVFADQFPDRDLCRTYCDRHGVPIFPTVRGAVGVGTSGVPVEGVLIIGEHGDYPRNGQSQQMYPRRRLFERVIDAFRFLGRRVPVFSDKHLSYDWPFARWMVELARHEGVPLMAGSSLPVAWRLPEVSVPLDSEVTEALSLGYGDLDAYGFHALEALQCMVERRRGGETGVRSVRCVSGGKVWEELAPGRPTRALLDTLEPARRAHNPNAPALSPRPRDARFQIEYADGLNASVAMIDCVGQCFAYTGRRRDVSDPDATVIALEEGHPFGHFGHLVRAIEHMVFTGTPPYPIERTLLTTGVLEALLRSRAEGGTRIATPHLAEVHYSPTDWPFAPGVSGTPA
ncbi:MAG: hypothetical protein AB7I30_10355 [Isosphaeraceae bacterium]